MTIINSYQRLAFGDHGVLTTFGTNVTAFAAQKTSSNVIIILKVGFLFFTFFSILVYTSRL